MTETTLYLSPISSPAASVHPFRLCIVYAAFEDVVFRYVVQSFPLSISSESDSHRNKVRTVGGEKSAESFKRSLKSVLKGKWLGVVERY